ncbi:SDR family oxidoreductase [Actinocorallia longicatena]|uniref:SDR family oxidoreductase n=1 Tax=Actinocorallia longicatena TaxID=111803 RepID=A0ABP6Q7X2_9ACTN
MNVPNNERVAVVSGAGTGIGRAIAVKFAALGWRVAVGGRRLDPLKETAALITEAGGTPFAHVLDVTDPVSVEEFFAATEKELGPVSVVINNAGLATSGPLETMTPEEVAAEVATKLTGSLYMSRQAVQAMRREGAGGDLLFITSTSAVSPWPHHVAYAAASAGAEQAARSLRLELEGTGIRVNIVRCGNTKDTDFATRELGTEQMMESSRLWFRQALVRHAGLLVPDEVADAVVTAVTLPPGVQYETLVVAPSAPPEDLPVDFEKFIESMILRHMPS